MRMMKARTVFSDRFLTMTGAAMLPVLFSCVTVNVHFPESTVQRATDDYVQELYRTRGGGEPVQQKKDSSRLENSPGSAARSKSLFASLPALRAAGLIAAGVMAAGGSASDSDAHAQATAPMEFNLKTAAAQKILSSQGARLNDVIRYKRQGFLGESKDGLLVLRGQSELESKKLLLNRVRKLIDDENADRKSLYEEAVNANSNAEVKSSVVAKSFARSFQAESPSGTWVEDSEGVWTRKK